MIKGGFRVLKNDFILGAPFHVHFEYSNISDRVISFAIGNSKADGYRFVSPSKGLKILNPYFEFGGFTEVVRLEPGENGSKDILLNRYIQFIELGKYQIRCEFDIEIGDELLHPITRAEFRDTIYLHVYEDRAQLSKLITALEQDLRKGKPLAQLRAIEVLSELRIERVLPILSYGLKSKDTAVVEMAIAGLGNLGGKDSVEILTEFMVASRSQSLQQKARQQLQNVGGRAKRVDAGGPQ